METDLRATAIRWTWRLTLAAALLLARVTRAQAVYRFDPSQDDAPAIQRPQGPPESTFTPSDDTDTSATATNAPAVPALNLFGDADAETEEADAEDAPPESDAEPSPD